jgi:hypothetical protein
MIRLVWVYFDILSTYSVRFFLMAAVYCDVPNPYAWNGTYSAFIWTRKVMDVERV